MRVSNKKINNTLKIQVFKTFIQALTDIKGYEQTEIFLNDFFTESELDSFAKRLAVSYWLKKGRSYKNIRTNLNVSTATIATIEKSMKRPGFQLLLAKVEAEEWATIWAERIKKFTKINK